MILERVCSGGQTGVDFAALRAARLASIPTGGWAPKGWLTETGPAPWLADYGLKECPEEGYPARTALNARDSDGTLWLGSGDSRGFGCTMKACRAAGNRPVFKVLTRGVKPSEVADWIREKGIRTLNVAGNRESSAPGIGKRAEDFLAEVFFILNTETGGETR